MHLGLGLQLQILYELADFHLSAVTLTDSSIQCVTVIRWIITFDKVTKAGLVACLVRQ